MDVFHEIRRRNVLRAGVLYIGAVWALAQGIAQLGPTVGAPEWATRWFLIAAAIGFPFWIAFAWFYEWTPQGLKRESDIAPGDSIAHSTARRLDFWIIGVLCVAVVLLVTNQFVLRRDATSTADAVDATALTESLAKLPEKSVAVLPLANDSGDPNQQYFSDGLSEELISDLTQIDGLKVIGKYSSFKFRDSKDSPAKIGAALGVAHLIQGSVRQQGERIRVTVSMIRAADGSSVWSHTYDDQLKDVFAIQTRIAEAVAGALQIKLLGQAIGVSDRPPSGNVEAYRLMLQGRASSRLGNKTGIEQGIALLKQAIKLDPEYAYAWGVLSNNLVNFGLAFTQGEESRKAFVQARAAADRQQVLVPNAADTYRIRGYLLDMIDQDPMGALKEYRRAYALAPNDGTTMAFLSGGLIRIGQLAHASKLMQQAIATDPLRADLYSNLGDSLLGQGQLDAAEQALRKALALNPGFDGLYARLAKIELLRGNASEAIGIANEGKLSDEMKAWSLAASMQIGPDKKKAETSVKRFGAKYGNDNSYLVAELYALANRPDPTFEWLERARTKESNLFFNQVLADPFFLPYQHDSRFTALCKRAGLPAPGEPLPDDIGSASIVAPSTSNNASDIP